MGRKRTSDELQSQRVTGHPSKPVSTNLRLGSYTRVSTQNQQIIPMQIRVPREFAADEGASFRARNDIQNPGSRDRVSLE